MSKNTKFALWMLAIPCLAASFAFYFVSPGPVMSNQSQKAAATQTQPQKSEALNFSELLKVVENEPQSISRIVFINGAHRVVLERHGQKPVSIAIPEGGEQELLAKASKSQVHVAANEGIVPDWIQALLPLGIIIGVMVLLWYMSQRNQRNMFQGPINGQNTGPAANAIKKVTFKEVAGCDEAVEELRRIVKGLVDADTYKAFGAKIPRGVLLKGPPGTGKTLLAKAVAGETDGSFDGISGSDFVEMFVGVGASRVRAKFAEGRAKVKATGKPFILFIDELDSVGGKRGGGLGNGGHQEREQTLNAILVEMDGIKDNDGIIIIGATNRFDMLDEALLRPGRFEVHVNVDLPDLAGREKIFAIHTRKKPLAPSASLATMAGLTYGYSGAEIEGACNRAAIIAAERYAAQRRKHVSDGLTDAEIDKVLRKEITLADLEEGAAVIKYGAPLTSRQKVLLEKDRLNTAYHESGHACVAARMKHANPVSKITIMMRGKALGYVQQMPDHDQVSLSDKQAISRIVVAMAGRAAQEVYTDTVDAGASNDFEQATGMARYMVTKWGMSRLGQISVGDRGESPFGGPSGGTIAYGADLANEIDREVMRIVRQCYQMARLIVEQDRERMETLCRLLMEKETVLRPEFEQLLSAIPSNVKDAELEFNPSAQDQH